MKKLSQLKEINGKTKVSDECSFADYPNGKHDFVLIKGKKICKSCGETK